MKLYENYCYETIENVADVIRSKPFVKHNNVIKGVVVNNNTIEIKFNKKPKNYDFIPPECTKLGFNSSYTGLTNSDANELGWLMALAMLSAWGIKILRRTL